MEEVIIKLKETKFKGKVKRLGFTIDESKKDSIPSGWNMNCF